MKKLIISNSSNENIYERVKSEILRQLNFYKEEGLKKDEIIDVDGSKMFVIEGLLNNKTIPEVLVLYNDLYLDSIILSSKEELEDIISIETLKTSILEKPLIRTVEELLDEEMNDLNSTLNHILVALRCGPIEDPNVASMNRFMYDIADILSREYGLKGKTSLIGESIHDKFTDIMNIELPKLTSDEKGLCAFELVDYFEEKMENSNFINLENKAERNLTSLLCRKNLEIHQSVRDLLKKKNPNAIVYDNDTEFHIIASLLDFDENSEQRLMGEIYDAFGAPISEYDAGRFKREHDDKLNIMRLSRTIEK